jgi:hypothetical protein
LESDEVFEIDICKDDIKTFVQVCMGVVESDKDDLVKCIYLRRLFEIASGKSDGYQVLSNALHKRERAVDSRQGRDRDGERVEMSAESFTRGCDEIERYVPGFSYNGVVARARDRQAMAELYESCSNGYEKLQTFRLLGVEVGNSVIKKFINETYHVENEYICQLDPAKFDTIPEYVVTECDRIVSDLVSDRSSA